jgi:hypothetical protein
VMRRVAAETRERKQTNASDNRKYLPGLDALEKESSITDIVPLQKTETDRMMTIVNKLLSSGTLKDAEKQAFYFWKANLVIDNAKGAVHQEFMRDFWAWLLGRGTEADHKKSPWYRQSLCNDSEVSAYVDAFVTKRHEFKIKLQLLSMRHPVGINQHYLYFKYVVRGQAPDSDHFLDDWQLFLNEFGDAREKGQKERNRDEIGEVYQGENAFHEMAPYGGTRKEDGKKAHEDKTKKILAVAAESWNSGLTETDSKPEVLPVKDEPDDHRPGPIEEDIDNLDGDDEEKPNSGVTKEEMADAFVTALAPLIEEIRKSNSQPPPPPPPSASVPVDYSKALFEAGANHGRMAHEIANERKQYEDSINSLKTRLDKVTADVANRNVAELGPSEEQKAEFEGLTKEMDAVKKSLAEREETSVAIERARQENAALHAENLKQLKELLAQGPPKVSFVTDQRIVGVLDANNQILAQLSENMSQGIKVAVDLGPVMSRLDDLEGSLRPMAIDDPDQIPNLQTARQQQLEAQVLQVMGDNQNLKQQLEAYKTFSDQRFNEQIQNSDKVRAEIIATFDGALEDLVDLTNAKQPPAAVVVQGIPGLDAERMQDIVQTLDRAMESMKQFQREKIQVPAVNEDSVKIDKIVAERTAAEQEKIALAEKRIKEAEASMAAQAAKLGAFQTQIESLKTAMSAIGQQHESEKADLKRKEALLNQKLEAEKVRFERAREEERQARAEAEKNVRQGTKDTAKKITRIVSEMEIVEEKIERFQSFLPKPSSVARAKQRAELENERLARLAAEDAVADAMETEEAAKIQNNAEADERNKVARAERRMMEAAFAEDMAIEQEQADIISNETFQAAKSKLDRMQNAWDDAAEALRQSEEGEQFRGQISAQRELVKEMSIKRTNPARAARPKNSMKEDSIKIKKGKETKASDMKKVKAGPVGAGGGKGAPVKPASGYAASDKGKEEMEPVTTPIGTAATKRTEIEQESQVTAEEVRDIQELPFGTQLKETIELFEKPAAVAYDDEDTEGEDEAGDEMTMQEKRRYNLVASEALEYVDVNLDVKEPKSRTEAREFLVQIMTMVAKTRKNVQQSIIAKSTKKIKTRS